MRQADQKGGEERLSLGLQARYPFSPTTLTDLSTSQAWKAYILLSCPDVGRKKQGASETRALCERTPPITNFSALSMLERCLRAMEAEDQLIAKLWMTAARARPQDAELQESWMMATFDAREWKQAQSVRT